MLPIQNLVSGKFQPRKNFDLSELDELATQLEQMVYYNLFWLDL